MALTHTLFSPRELVQQIGENARALRLAQNLSRKTLAERAGVSESTIKRFETTGQITLDALVLLPLLVYLIKPKFLDSDMSALSESLEKKPQTAVPA